MKSKILMAVLIVFFSVTTWADPVVDPLADYLSKYGPGLVYSKAKELISFEIDLNGDGKNEVFITNDTKRNFRSGYTWKAYISVDDRYIKTPSGGGLSFFYDGIYSGYIDELGKVGLLKYQPGSANDGALVAYTVDDGVLAEHNLGTIYPSGKDKALFEKYFNKKIAGLEVKKQNFNDVMKAYANSIELKNPAEVAYGKEELEFAATTPPAISDDQVRKPDPDIGKPEMITPNAENGTNKSVYYFVILLVLLLVVGSILFVKKKDK